MSKKVLIATAKPFAPAAVEEVEALLKGKGYELVLLEKYGDKGKFLSALPGVNALVVRSDKVDGEVLDAAKDLKIVVRAGAGYDNVDCQAASDQGVVVMNTPGQNANAVAELAIGMMIYMARNQFNGKPGTELKGKTLGLLGFGAVGRRLAKLARGLDMEVESLDPWVEASCFEAEGVHRCEQRPEVFSRGDYVSLHIPATKDNLGCIGYDAAMEMKPGACLVNTARKEIIDEEGLLRALAERGDLKYASDIAPDRQDAFLSSFADQCFFTPKKMGAQTAEANVNAGVAAARQIIGFFEKGDTTFQVNT